MGPGPAVAQGPFGPRARLGPGPIGPRARLGPGPIWAPGPGQFLGTHFLKIFCKNPFRTPEGRFFRVLFFLRVSLETEGPGPQGGPVWSPAPGPVPWAHGPMSPCAHGPWAPEPMGPLNEPLGPGPMGPSHGGLIVPIIAIVALLPFLDPSSNAHCKMPTRVSSKGGHSRD